MYTEYSIKHRHQENLYYVEKKCKTEPILNSLEYEK